MCGRFTLTLPDYEAITGALRAAMTEGVRALSLPRFNVCPGDLHGVLIHHQGHRVLVAARWGLDRRDGGTMVNSRAESLREGRGIHGQPCVVPVDGYFEWSGKGAQRFPSWVHRGDGHPFLLAGVLVPVRPDEPPRFTVITRPSAADIGKLHHRMPATVEREQLDTWLASPRADPPAGWLEPLERSGLDITPVSRHVNRPAHDDPCCIAPRRSSEGAGPSGD